MTIRFEVQKFKAGRNGQSPVETFIRANGKRVKMTLIKRLKPDEWDSKNQTLLVNNTALFAALKAHGIVHLVGWIFAIILVKLFRSVRRANAS